MSFLFATIGTTQVFAECYTVEGFEGVVSYAGEGSFNNDALEVTHRFLTGENPSVLQGATGYCEAIDNYFFMCFGTSGDEISATGVYALDPETGTAWFLQARRLPPPMNGLNGIMAMTGKLKEGCG